MLKGNRPLKHCGRITAIVILLSFLMTFPVFGEPPMEQPQSLTESGTRLYSDSEVDSLIEDISIAAKEAIEKAAAEAAKAAALASVEREAQLLHEKIAANRETQRWKSEAETAKKDMRKACVMTMVIGLLGGIAIGIGMQNLHP